MGSNSVTALDNVSLDIGEGEFVAIQGTSGSGKSTLARGILRLIKPSAGSVMVDGNDVLKMSERAFRPRRFFEETRRVPTPVQSSAWENRHPSDVS